MTDYSRAERVALCDLLDEVGPDQPTLCAGWTTFDLAVHLHVREADPLAGPGLMMPSLADTTERRMAAVKAKHSYREVVAKVRNGPPTFSIFSFPGLGKQLNVTEYFVHHEDIRRARAGFQPRALPAEQQDWLWKQLKLAAKGVTRLRAFRLAPTGIVLRRPDGSSVTAHPPTDLGSVTVTGEPAELVLFCFGRQAVAQVELAGPDEAVSRLRTASFGV